MQNSIIKFDRVSLQYQQGPYIIEDVSFNLYPGTFHYLTGASGAGKSSLLKLMYSGTKDYRGTIKIFDRDLRYLKPQELAHFRQQIGFIFQDFLLLDHLTTLDNIALPLRLKGEKWSECRKKAQQMMKWIGLEGFEEAMPTTLSGGQKQRIALARALVKNPSILILDDTTSSVDMETEHEIQQTLHNLAHDRTTLIIAHRISSVKNADQIVVLNNGRIVEQGKHDELLKKKGYYYSVFVNQYGDFDNIYGAEVI